jgi:hypothetical protein
MKSNSRYMQRALQSRDPRFAAVLGKLGHTAPEADAAPIDPVYGLRATYRDVTGEDADKRWGAPRLQQEIDDALSARAGKYGRRDMRAKD